MDQITEFKSFSQILNALPDDKACREYLEKVRWPDGTLTCPHCGSVNMNHYKLKKRENLKACINAKGVEKDSL